MIIDVCETQSGYSFFLTDALNLSRQLSNSLTIRNPPWNVARNTLFISIYVCVEITIYHYWHQNKTNNFTLHIYLQKQKCQHIIYYLNFWNVATQKIIKKKAWLFRDRRSHRLIRLSHHLVYHQPVIIGLVCFNLPASFGLHEAKDSKFVPAAYRHVLLLVESPSFVQKRCLRNQRSANLAWSVFHLAYRRAFCLENGSYFIMHDVCSPTQFTCAVFLIKYPLLFFFADDVFPRC